MEVYSLFELNQYIRQVIALNFVDTIWITCELSQVTRHRANCYIDLIEKDEITDEVKAQSSAVIWGKEFAFIKKKLGVQVDKILQPGMTVKLKVELDFNERYGFKLLIKDIDPSYTFGQLALIREQIIQRLKSEDRINTNGLIPLPKVIQRIAIISSENAAGYKDLTEHLASNNYGYDFRCTLYSAAMQGSRVEMEVVSQLREIKEQASDVVIITRGGGSKLDLSGFDSYAIAKEISEYPIPVFTGIGHEIDESICDLVSNRSFKTPTAVANYLIDHNALFETTILDLAVRLQMLAKEKLSAVDHFLNSAPHLFQERIAQQIQSKENAIDLLRDQIPLLTQNKLLQFENHLGQIEAYVNASDPNNILKKGFAIIRTKENEIIKSIDQVHESDEITTVLKDGTFISTIHTLNNSNG